VFYNTKHFVLIHPKNPEKPEAILKRILAWAKEHGNEVKLYFVTYGELKRGCKLLAREKMTFWNPQVCQIVPADKKFDKMWDEHAGGNCEARVRVCN
jgi:hypothetical protein